MKLLTKLILFSLLIISFTSCNYVTDAIMVEVKNNQVDTLDVTEYTSVIDKKNRRGYVTLENEVMDGRYIITKAGTMVEELNLEGGFLSGQLIRFYENGVPEVIETYKTSVQHGPTTHFYSNGNVRSETSFTNGVQDPEEVEYDENGNIQLRKTITDGVAYEHSYHNGNRMISVFNKTIDNKEFELLMKYDNFGTIVLIIGKPLDIEDPLVYIFDSEFKEIDRFNGEENPMKAQQYISLLQS